MRGAVQGVGFRPFVWKTANELSLTGWVLNDTSGVLAEVEGAPANLEAFERRLHASPPPLARVDQIETAQRRPMGGASFEIRTSQRGGPARTAVTADVATCPDCLADMFDPQNRRYLYPFTNCTHCGPRYTITHRLPYDRAETSMAAFKMCNACQTEYDDPADRRFHAQPNACPDCGPRIDTAPKEIAERLAAGETLAVKGLGGFHLCVDAYQQEAVQALRLRKNRDGKPFAVMVANLASARRLAELTDAEEQLLTLRSRPIVIVKARTPSPLAPSVSNGLPTIGLMLPYSPLHYLIFHAAIGAPDNANWLHAAHDAAFVFTSANPSGEPLIFDNSEAQRKLRSIADHIVSHDRQIVVRCDDSVARVISEAPAYLRRARGCTPEPIQLPFDAPPTLAVGGHLKSAVCVVRGREAFLSQHIGDLDNEATINAFYETSQHMLSILDVKPERIACDLHPDFASTRYAEATRLPLLRVQHHHAHLAAVAAERQITAPVLGLALDGYGLGEDGRDSWGGELLELQGASFRRLGRLRRLAQPGGDAAARAPWRMAAAALHDMGRADLIKTRFADRRGVDMLKAMLERQVNAPKTSSAGRYFDAACGLLGLVPEASFEAEAPMTLEALATEPRVLRNGWRISADGVLDLTPLLRELLEETPASGASLFHGTLAAALADWAANAHASSTLEPTILGGGGCFQNRVLSEGLAEALNEKGLNLALPAQAPANDGGLSLG
ncbi:MAG: carbamoyltransferase HypF, partial [Pseudomonadota bacterium]